MAAVQLTLDQLTQFRQRDIFSFTAWEARGLNPSGEHVSGPLRTHFYTCADQLSAAVAAGYSKKQLRTILTSTLDGITRTGYDTEEREFIADLFLELATIVGVDFKTRLNRWLYGMFLASLITVFQFLRPGRVVAIQKHPCRQCSLPLETQILRKEAGIPDYAWTVAKCSRCGDLNLLSFGLGVKQIRPLNYQSVEILPKDEFTEEQAQTRLEQIKYFRKF